MGVPTEPREQTDTTEDVKQGLHAQSPSTTAADSGIVEDVEAEEDSAVVVEDGDGEEGDTAGKSEVLDENANVDFKIERLKLDGLTDENDDDAPPKRVKKTGDVKSRDGRMKNGEGDITSQEREDLEKGEDGETGEDGDRPEGEENDEEEEEPPEMTLEERKEMHDAVKAGDIDLLEDLLDKPNADITMVYFNENLLMAALRADQLQMAEFLLDNGVDHTFTTTMMSVPTHHGSGKQQQAHKKALEIYKYTCRQMAYDKGFLDIVDIIDMLDGRLFPGVKPRPRVPRLRRPPPTPVSSSESSDSDSSASSGDESDISGDTRSRLGADEDSTLELSPTRSASLSTPVGDTLTVPKLRRKKKKKEKLDVGDGESQAAEEDPEAGKKKKRRKHGEEEKTPSEADDRSQGKQSGSSQAGDLTDRSKGTAKSSEHTADGEGDEEEGVQDEGYETMSPSPNGISPAARNQQPQQLAPRFQPPSIPVKPTKAYLALRRTTETHKQHCIPTKYNEARPLHWKKVKATGSYQTESPLWHQQVSLSPKLPPPTPMGTATTVSMLSPRSVVQPRSEASMVSTVEISAGNVTKPKILHPSYRGGSGKSSSTAISSASSTGGNTAISTAYTPTNDRLYPLKLKVPGYMRMTTSCFVKRRLDANFTSTYSSLEFVEPSAAFSSARGSGETTSKGNRISSENSAGLVRKSLNVSLSGRTGDGLPTVLDVSSSNSPTFSRKKPLGMGGVGVDSVPSIRNSSSVVPTPKLTLLPAKVR